MRIDSDRPWSDLMTFRSIGALPGSGNDRVALTDAGRALFPLWRVAGGRAVTVDANVLLHATIQHADR